MQVVTEATVILTRAFSIECQCRYRADVGTRLGPTGVHLQSLPHDRVRASQRNGAASVREIGGRRGCVGRIEARDGDVSNVIGEVADCTSAP